MPIKGITDRGLAFPEIGRIRKGSPKGANGEMGKDLDYFRVVFDENEIESEKAFRAAYGEKPKAINCVLWEDEYDKIASSWLECHVAGRMIARSDGEIYLFKVNHTTGEMLVKNGKDKDGKTVPYDPEVPEYSYKNKKGQMVDVFCKPITRMRVLIPELGRAAYLLLVSSSLYDAMNLSENLRAISGITNGHPSKIPLVLSRKVREVSCPDADGKRARRKKSLLFLEISPDWVQARIAGDKVAALALAAGQALPALEAPKDEEENGENGEDITQDEPDQTGEFGQEKAPASPVPPAAPEKPELPPLRYQPEQLKVRLGEIATKMTGTANGKRGLVVVLLETILSMTTDPSASRHQLLKYLTGKASSKDIDDPTILALFKWLSPTQDAGGEWLPDAMSAREAIAAFNAAQPPQKELF